MPMFKMAMELIFWLKFPRESKSVYSGVIAESKSVYSESKSVYFLGILSIFKTLPPSWEAPTGSSCSGGNVQSRL